MLAIERKTDILNLLKQNGYVKVSELSRRFNVTDETIRRDLEKLERDGFAIKSHGGAVINETTGIEFPFNTRMKQNIEGKQLIAEIIAGMIMDGSQITLDASSTSVFVAKALKKKQKLTAITNSMEIAVELADKPDIELISIGGQLESRYLAFTGPKAVRFIGEYNPDIAVISCKGFDIERGAMDSSDSIAATKQAMIASANFVILAADQRKFGKRALCRLCGLNDLDCIVTDEDPGEGWKDYLMESGVECIYPGKQRKEHRN